MNTHEYKVFFNFLVLVGKFGFKQIMLTDKVTLNYKLQLRPSSQSNNGCGEQYEDVNEPAHVPVNKCQPLAGENLYCSSENVTTEPTNATHSEQMDSSGRWTQHSERTVSVSVLCYISRPLDMVASRALCLDWVTTAWGLKLNISFASWHSLICLQ